MTTQASQRKMAEFTPPSSQLKNKVGSGGLHATVLAKAQAVLDNNRTDFKPLGESFLEDFHQQIRELRNGKAASGHDITEILFTAMLFKSNGAMFQYPLVTRIADKLVSFLDALKNVDMPALEVIEAFYASLKALIVGQIRGDGGTAGQSLFNELTAACQRYNEKYPENISAN